MKPQIDTDEHGSETAKRVRRFWFCLIRVHPCSSVVPKALVLVALICGQASAATKLFFRTQATAPSSLGKTTASGSAGYGCNPTGGYAQQIAGMTTTAGSASVGTVLTPTSSAPPCQIGHTSLTNFYTWYSAPLSSGLTLSGNVDFNITCSESNNALNAGIRVSVYRWDVSTGGNRELVISGDTTECAGSRIAIAAAAPSSTVFNTGDRLWFVIEVINVGGSWGGNSSRTATFSCGAASGSSGDSFANFADTLSFASETNNNPAKGFSQ